MSPSSNDDRNSPLEPDDSAIAELVATAASSPDHPTWRDQRFLAWLAEQQPIPRGDLADLGREVMARAYCRHLRVSRIQGFPLVVDVDHLDQNEPAAPLLRVSDLVRVPKRSAQRVAPGRASRAVVLPTTLPSGTYVAVHLPLAIGGAPPFLHAGDTVLLIVGGVAAWSPRATIAVRDDRLTMVVGDGPVVDELGIVAAVWCPHQPEA